MVNDEQRPEDKSAGSEYQSREPTAAESHASEISSEPLQTPADYETRTQAAPGEPADGSHASEISSEPVQTPADDETRTQAAPGEPADGSHASEISSEPVQTPADDEARTQAEPGEPADSSHASEISSDPLQTPADDEMRTQAEPREPADGSHASEISSEPLQTPADDEMWTQAAPAEPAKGASAPEVELGEAQLAAGVDTNGTSGQAAPAATAETAELADGASAAAPSSAYASKEGEMETAAPRTPWGALLVSGLIGGALVALAGYVWLSNRLDEGATNVLLARVGAVELAVRDLSAAGGQSAEETQDRAKLTERLAKLEAGIANVAKSAQAAPDPALANRLTALEAVAKSLTDQLVRLDRRAGETESALQAVRERGAADGEAPAGQPVAVVAPKPPDVTKAEFGMLSDRVGTLQKALAALQQNPQPRTGGVVDDRAALTVVTAGLRDAVERGTAFAGELKAAKALGADAQQIAPLEPFAASGVPSAAALGRELAKLAPDMMPEGSGLSRDASYIDRLQAQAERLVRFRPVGGAPGQDVVAVVSRIEAKAKQADIAGALAEIRELPETARAPAEPWIKKAEARAAAIAAAQNLEAAALAALAANP